MVLFFRLVFLLIFEVYPKVKVRTDGEADHRHAGHEYKWRTLLSLKDIQFLLLQDSCFPVKEYRDISLLPVARIPESYVAKIITPTDSASEGSDKRSNSDEEERPKIRASSVPRPRAVLSSPDNDAVIGSKNRTKTARPSASKSHNSVHSRHAQSKEVHALMNVTGTRNNSPGMPVMQKERNGRHQQFQVGEETARPVNKVRGGFNRMVPHVG